MFSNFQIQRIFVERQSINNSSYFNSDGMLSRVPSGMKMGASNFSSPRVREMSDTSSSESELSDMEMDNIPVKVSRKNIYSSTHPPLSDEVNDSAREHVQLKFKLMDLWNTAESKFSFGKFKDCLECLDQAEHLIRESFSDSDNFKLLLAKCFLGKGKSKFKLGDIKKARYFVSESLQLHYTEEGDSILKEIEKMTYFEGLIEISMNDPSSLESSSTNGMSSSLLSTSPYSCFFQKALASPPNSPPQKSNHPIYQTHTLSPPLVTNRMDFELLTNGYVSVVHPRVIPLSTVPRHFTQPTSVFDSSSNPLQQSVNSESSWQQMYLQHQKQQRLQQQL